MATTNFLIKAEDGWVQIDSGGGVYLRVTGVPSAGTFQLYNGSSTPPVNSTAATGTITLSSTGPADGNTVVIGGQTFTFKTTPSAATDIQIDGGANNTTTAASAVTKINANSTVVSATSALGVITLTARTTGTAGNAITLTKVGANIAVSGATLSGAVDIAIGITVDCCRGVKINAAYTNNLYARINNSRPDRPLRLDVLKF